MPAYLRPAWSDPVFLDSGGAAIEYGSRWGWDGPPANTYGLDTHPERFAPLHVVADALIEHLAETYDVQIIRELACALDFLRPPAFERVVRLSPNDSDAAPLTFGFTTYPGIFLRAGSLHEFNYPVCGCDACDETAVGLADQLEWHVSAVVAGHYREAYSPAARLPLQFALWSEGIGKQTGSSTADGYPADLLATAGAKLRNVADHWVEWPRKA